MKGTDFIVPPGHDLSLAKRPTRIDPICTSKHDYHKLFDDHIKRLDEQQRLQYASNRQAILLIFQAMDAAGKDGAIRHVLSGVNPQGCQVFSYQHPSATELQHDFLWRTTRDLPERAASASSTAPTMRKCWSCAFTPNSCAPRRWQSQ